MKLNFQHIWPFLTLSMFNTSLPIMILKLHRTLEDKCFLKREALMQEDMWMEEVHVLRNQFSTCLISIISKEANVAALALAQLGALCNVPKVWVEEFPVEIQDVLLFFFFFFFIFVFLCWFINKIFYYLPKKNTL